MSSVADQRDTVGKKTTDELDNHDDDCNRE